MKLKNVQGTINTAITYFDEVYAKANYYVLPEIGQGLHSYTLRITLRNWILLRDFAASLHITYVFERVQGISYDGRYLPTTKESVSLFAIRRYPSLYSFKNMI